LYDELLSVDRLEFNVPSGGRAGHHQHQCANHANESLGQTFHRQPSPHDAAATAPHQCSYATLAFIAGMKVGLDTIPRADVNSRTDRFPPTPLIAALGADSLESLD
jgi:hypothetical protein